MRSDAPHGGTRPDAASAIVRLARDVAEAVDTLLHDDDMGSHPDRIHRLRVSSRRTLVALDMCGLSREDRPWRMLRRRVRTLRKAAGAVRDCDVHSGLLRGVSVHPGSPPSVGEALTRIDTDRRLSLEALRLILAAHKPAAIRRDARRIRDLLREESASRSRSFRDPPRACDIAAATARLESAAATDLSQPPNLHELRLAVKGLRYAVEVRMSTDKAGRAALDRSLLAAAQQRLGEVNDIATLTDRLNHYAGGASPQDPVSDSPAPLAPDEGLQTLHDRFAAVLATRCQSAASWWHSMLGRRDPEISLLQFLTSPLPETEPKEPAPMIQQASAASAPVTQPGLTFHPSPNTPTGISIAGLVLGVIDVGSNSVRLLAVEVAGSGTQWRVLCEERAMTRLAHGLARDGLLATDAMARSVEAVSRFKTAAANLGVSHIRAYATAAVRDARNGNDFVSLVLDRTGLNLEVVSAQDEGRLTYLGVSRVHDLSLGTAAVLDIGGGSLELVLSDGGVITRNESMPLGAVRITEQFGGADECSTRKFKDMREFIERSISTHVPSPATPPAVLIGCGGTCTTITSLVAHNASQPGDPATPVSREQIRELIVRLRGMTHEERLRVPGLASDRADIVIAGLVCVERLMKRLGSSRLVTHPGGLREGLVIRLIEEAIASRDAETENHEPRIIHAARDLARRCRYPAPHSEHVCGLAISLYDQLLNAGDRIAGLGTEPGERAILAAAAILHDVGIMIEYRAHHKHSADIIRQNGLACCTARQTELIALIARYHRRATPSLKHAGFAALPASDQNLVRRLAAILRCVDGLDRPHKQSVRSLKPVFARKKLCIELSGDGNLDAEVAAAAAKSNLLAQVSGLAPVYFVPAPSEAEQSRCTTET